MKLAESRRWPLVAAAALVVALLAPIAALAKGTSEPAAAGQAWYWKEQNHQEIQDPLGNTYTIEGPNPFCPSVPGDLGAPSQSCAPGRLPVEIQGGDYDQPDKMSAVNFDLSLVPIGSKIQSFKVTFLEAKAGCYDDDGDGKPDRCEETDPQNLSDTTQLQACQVTEFFGNGPARPYDEAPKYQCVSSDPTAKRKEAKVEGAQHPVNDTTPDHVWTFDLTPLAKTWTTGTTQTSVMLVGAPPKGYDSANKDPKDNWRVVLSGPQMPEGITTSLKYTPPATPPPPPPTDTGGGTTTPTTTGTDFGTTGTTFGTGTTTSTGGSTDFGTGSTGSTDTGSTDTAPAPQPSPIAAVAPSEPTNDFPLYMWLAILAGIVGFSLVRSVVIEATTGVRPNGVIAQIKSLNAARKGTAAAGTTGATDAGGSGAVAGALGSVGEGFSSFAGRIKSIFKRG